MSSKPWELSCRPLNVCGRASALAKIQVEEVEGLLESRVPGICFHNTFVESSGDKQQHISLRTLGRTDFFTKELDLLVLEGVADVAVHSAKDLAHPLPEGLQIVAITKGVEPWDSLVLRKGVDINKLKKPLIAVSSERREDAVRELIKDACFADIRGTIEKRLEAVFSGQVEGLVVAEAALVRLGLTHLNRVRLGGKTPFGQGKLAVVAKRGNIKMQELFSVIDSGCRES